MTEGRHTCPNLQVRGYVPIQKKEREQTDGGRGRGKEREREKELGMTTLDFITSMTLITPNRVNPYSQYK